MKSLMDDSTISTNGLTQQLKIYNDMDRVTYHNKDLDFAFGLSMTSKNVARYESINNENLKVGILVQECLIYTIAMSNTIVITSGRQPI